VILLNVVTIQTTGNTYCKKSMGGPLHVCNRSKKSCKINTQFVIA